MCTNDNLENRKGRKRAREKISVVGGGCGDNERVKQKPRRTQQNIKIKNKTKQNMEGKEQKTMVWMQERHHRRRCCCCRGDDGGGGGGTDGGLGRQRMQ